MPPLVAEMAALFDSPIFHIGGDEADCKGVSDFEAAMIPFLELLGYAVMGWSEIGGHATNSTIIQSWRSPNASTLAAQGTFAVESAPGHLYLHGSAPSIGNRGKNGWFDMGLSEVPPSHRHYHLGGEAAVWTDAYCFINDCVRPGDGPVLVPGLEYL